MTEKKTTKKRAAKNATVGSKHRYQLTSELSDKIQSPQ